MARDQAHYCTREPAKCSASHPLHHRATRCSTAQRAAPQRSALLHAKRQSAILAGGHVGQLEADVGSEQGLNGCNKMACIERVTHVKAWLQNHGNRHAKGQLLTTCFITRASRFFSKEAPSTPASQTCSDVMFRCAHHHCIPCPPQDFC